MSERRNRWLAVVLLAALGASVAMSAAAWQISGFLAKGASTADRHVWVSVADENGQPVQGLKEGDFTVESFACATPPCSAKPARVQLGTNFFKELTPGVYALQVKLDSASTITPALVVRVKQTVSGRSSQRAQMVIRETAQ